MGILSSTTNHRGKTVNGVVLGHPTILTSDRKFPSEGTSVDQLCFCWEDYRLPDGILDEEGTIVGESTDAD